VVKLLKHVTPLRLLVLTAGASVSYLVTRHFMASLSIPGFRRNYLALWLVCVLIAWVLIASRRNIDRGVAAIVEQLEHMLQAGRLEAVTARQGGQLAELTEPLNRLLDQARTQYEQLSVLNRQLRGQLSTAARERRNVESVINSLSEAVIVTNWEGELILANPAAEKSLGIRSAQSIGRRIDEEIPKAGLGELISRARSGDLSPNTIVERTLQCNDGTRTFNIALNPVAMSGQHPAGMVMVLRDVTRQRDIAEMKSDFVSTVSHELKTPLAAIKAYAEMLLDGEADDQQIRHSFYKIIHSEAQRLQRLIENVLNVSRIESGAVGVRRKPFSLTDIVANVLNVAAVQARAKKIDIFTDLAVGDHYIHADPDLVYQCVMNLMSNAIKYTCEGGEITVMVSVDKAAKTARCRVSDNGIGIPPEHLPHIFERFYRSPASEAMAEGTGLGLTLVKYVVETIYQGKVFVSSKVGEGSTFGFELPLHECGSQSVDEKPEALCGG